MSLSSSLELSRCYVPKKTKLISPQNCKKVNKQDMFYWGWTENLTIPTKLGCNQFILKTNNPVNIYAIMKLLRIRALFDWNQNLLALRHLSIFRIGIFRFRFRKFSQVCSKLTGSIKNKGCVSYILLDKEVRWLEKGGQVSGFLNHQSMWSKRALNWSTTI
jgi:hypothetical protein